jgi:hypothetical protein
MLEAISQCIDIIQIDDNVQTQADILEYAINKDYRLQLAKMFKNYFSEGKYTFDGVKTTEKNKEYLGIIFDEFLALYKFLNYSWNEIKDVFTTLDTPVKTPGQAVIYLLTKRTKESWDRRGKKANTQALYRGFKEAEKLEILLEKPNPATEKIVEQTEKVQKYYHRVAKNTGRYTADTTDAEIIIEVCMCFCDKSKNKFAKKALAEYREKLNQSKEFSLKMLRQKF